MDGTEDGLASVGKLSEEGTDSPCALEEELVDVNSDGILMY
jgi:hypothetical protein